MKLKGDWFELAVKWLLLNDPTYGLVGGDVRLWAEAPVGKDSQERPWRWHEQETGTDLLAYPEGGKKGELVAVQAKAWSRGHSITKSEVDSFLADSNRSAVGTRIFATTADSLNSKALATLRGQEKPVTLVTFGTLMDAPIAWPKSLKALQKALNSPRAAKKSVPTTLRPYQEKVVKDAVNHFQAGGTRGKVIMACGTGKTITAQRITEALEPDRVLVLFPSLMLLKQTLQEWLVNADPRAGGFDWIAVCSDDTVADTKYDNLVSRVIDLGLPNVTTDPTHIQTFLNGSNGGRRRVVFSTYQSSPQVVSAMTGTCLKFDLMVCDEAHRMARVTKTSGKSTARDPFAAGLDDNLVPARRRVFLTATPKVYGEKVKRKAKDPEQEVLVSSMDDETLFGPVIASYTFKQAIEGVNSSTGPVLADYKVLAVLVSESELQTMLANRDHVSLTTREGDAIDVTDTQTLATQIAILKAMEHPKHGITSLISYHHTIKGAEGFQARHNLYRAALGLDSIAVDIVRGSDPASKRPDKLAILTASKRPGAPKALVSNARCLAEGIDVPLLDGVAFVDPKGSLVDIVQAVGRAIRRPSDSEKTTGYIIVPIYLTSRLITTLQETQARLAVNGQSADVFGDTTLDPTALQGIDSDLNQAFKPVAEVLRKLRSMDEALTESIQQLKLQRGARGHHTPDRTYVNLSEAADELHLEIFDGTVNVPPVDGSTETKEIFPKLAVPLRSFHDAIHLVTINAVLNRTTDDWWERCGSLDAHYRQHGQYPSSTAREVEKRRLAIWMSVQRGAYRNGGLSQRQIKTLESLPDWEWNPRESEWETAYEFLAELLNENDGAYPSTKANDPEIARAAFWTRSQRALYLRGALTEDRARRLEQLRGWEWEVQRTAWQRQFDALRDHLSSHNQRYPQQNVTDPVEGGLGKWVSKQRVSYGKGKLSGERIAALEALPGWAWDGVDAAWNRTLDELRDFLTAHDGQYPSTRSKDVGEKDLAKWVSSQRGFHKRGKLLDSRIPVLEGLPGWYWDPLAARWDQYLVELKEFLAESGGEYPRPTGEDSKVKGLGTWVTTQRAKYAKGTMPDDRVEALEALPGWQWTVRNFDELWETRFASLKKWLSDHDGAYPSQKSSDPDEIRLATWLRNQIGRRQQLTAQRIQKLKDLPEWRWRLQN